MDLNTIRDRCETRFRDTTNDVLDVDEWAEYINDAYQFVNQSTPFWPVFAVRAQTVSFPAGTRAVELAEDVWQVNSVYNTNDDWPLSQLHGSTSHLHAFPDPSTNTGSPVFYRIVGNFMEVYPVPVVAVDLEVEQRVGPVELVQGTDEPWFPERYHRMLVSGALALAYEDDGNLQQSAVHQSRFDASLQALEEALLQPQGQEYTVINDTWYD